MFFKKIFFLSSAIFSLLLADRLTKFFAVEKSSFMDFFLISKKYFSFGFKFFENKNLAFSIPFPQIVIIFMVIAIVIYLLSVLYKKYQSGDFYSIYFLSLVICGALSNLFDRIYYGFVIDFINIFIIFFKFAVFNIADCMIVIGVIGLIIKELKTERKK